jgi:hypothetical protein
MKKTRFQTNEATRLITALFTSLLLLGSCIPPRHEKVKQDNFSEINSYAEDHDIDIYFKEHTYLPYFDAKKFHIDVDSASWEIGNTLQPFRVPTTLLNKVVTSGYYFDGFLIGAAGGSLIGYITSVITYGIGRGALVVMLLQPFFLVPIGFLIGGAWGDNHGIKTEYIIKPSH